MEHLLDPETLYVMGDWDDTYVYVRTPDGVGCYWYEDEGEAMADVCTPKRRRYFDSVVDFELYRYG